ncbi:MAG: hypothetical protein J6Y55_00590 [Bacteroidales bacterium]|nr:hypothetical protein [Bacteroidales bacterium]
MKYRLVKIIANVAVMALVFPMSLSAQTEENPELQKTIQVYSEYKPQISDASRISVNPKVYDTLDIQMNLKYSVTTTPLNTDYHIIPLKAVSVTGDKLSELYRGEAVVGLGNYWTGLLAVRYMTERSRLKQSGIELYHFGSAGKIKVNGSKVPAGYTTDYVSAYWKRFYEDCMIYASVKPQFNSVLRYGYGIPDTDPSGTTVVRATKKEQRRYRIGLSANAGVRSIDADEDAFRYNADAQYDLTYAGNPTNLENLLGVTGSVDRKLGKIALGLDADFQLSALNFEPKDIDSSLSNVQSVLQATPFIQVGANNWKLRAGIKASPVMGGISTFKILPNVAFQYAIPNLQMVPYFNFGGNVDLVSMNEMFEENPYVADSVMIRPTINKLGFEIGLNGRVKKLITYNTSFSVKAYEDMYFWKGEYKRLGKNMTTFGVVYDDATVMNFHGDFGLLFRKVNFMANFDYYLWQLQNEKEAWYKPIVDVSLASRFYILNPNTNKNKLAVEPNLSYKLFTSEGHGDYGNIDNLDLGLKATYFYNSIFQIFLDVNYLLWGDERYIDYQLQRFNFLIGASFSFGGHKE